MSACVASSFCTDWNDGLEVDGSVTEGAAKVAKVAKVGSGLAGLAGLAWVTGLYLGNKLML
jgi:hypothetical protein